MHILAWFIKNLGQINFNPSENLAKIEAKKNLYILRHICNVLFSRNMQIIFQKNTKND